MAATERLLALCSIVAFACSCALQPVGRDGLSITDASAPFATSQDPITGATGGVMTSSTGMTGNGATGGVSARSCANLSSFSTHAAPLLSRDCARCHNGTKGKATQLLNLTTIKDTGVTAQQTACANTLTTTDAANPSASNLFRVVDPANVAVLHDFKYATAADFNAFRAALLMWLATE